MILRTLLLAMACINSDTPAYAAGDYSPRANLHQDPFAGVVSYALFDSYCRSFKMACCAWLDCDRAAMPVCSRTLYCVIFATVVPMSAFCRLFCALVRFVTSVF